MPNPENIVKHKFKKGQSGNPKGRPTIKPLLDLLEENIGTDGAQKILQSLYKRAVAGDIRAAEMLLERLYGKVAQGIEHSGELKSKIQIEVTDPRIGEELKKLLE